MIAFLSVVLYIISVCCFPIIFTLVIIKDDGEEIIMDKAIIDNKMSQILL